MRAASAESAGNGCTVLQGWAGLPPAHPDHSIAIACSGMGTAAEMSDVPCGVVDRGDGYRSVGWGRGLGAFRCGCPVSGGVGGYPPSRYNEPNV